MNQGVLTGRPSLSLVTLPDDILFVLVSYLDLQSLARFSRCNKRLYRVCGQDCVWVQWKKAMSMVKSPSNAKVSSWLPVKEHCRLSNNWIKGLCSQFRQMKHSVKQLPWLQMEWSKLWISTSNRIQCYQQKPNGHLREIQGLNLCDHTQDVSRFKTKQGLIISGSREASICAYRSDTGELLLKLENCHNDEIQDIDFYNSVIVSGSRDSHIKIWSMTEFRNDALKYVIPLGERIWSLAVSPDGDTFVTGSAGLKISPPLKLWDLETGQELGDLGRNYRYGAGVLDVYYESPDVLYSCGHDTLVRVWDLRMHTDKCVLRWEEPYDSTVYTVRTDGGYSVLAGTAKYGLIHLWDKRTAKSSQLYYVGHRYSSSPVYSLAFNAKYMYVALDKEISLVDFTAQYLNA